MARPSRTTIQNGQQSWDTDVNDNFITAFDEPFPIALHTGDESDIESTYPAASFDKCLIWVEHTVDGWELYVSDGASWAPLATGGGGGGPLTIENISSVGTISAGTQLAVCSGTTYTVTLPVAATAGAGFLIHIKSTASGTITVDGDSAETIDGAATFDLDTTNMSVTVVSDGSNWLIV